MVLTPNVNEFGRLCKALVPSPSPSATASTSGRLRGLRARDPPTCLPSPQGVHEADGADPLIAARAVAVALGHATVVRKGKHDIVTDGMDGTAGPGACWAGSRAPHAIRPRKWVRRPAPDYVCTVEGSPRRCGGQGDLLAGSVATFLAWALRHPLVRLPAGAKPTLLAAYAGCAVVREAGRLTYARLGRGALAGDILHDLPAALAHSVL